MINLSVTGVRNCVEVIEKKCAKLPQDASNENIQNAKDLFYRLKDTAQAKGALSKYMDKVINLAENMENNGNKVQKNISKVIFGEIIKVMGRSDKGDVRLLKVIKLNIEQHKNANDSLHVLSRLHSLADFYKKANNKTQYYNTLKEELNCVNGVLKDYETASANFKSINKPARSKVECLKEKAAICNDLATTTAHEKRNKSIIYLKEAIQIYKELNMQKELLFAEKQLKRIKTSKMNNKLKRYNGTELHQETFSKANLVGINNLSKKPIIPAYKKWDFSD